MVLEEIKCPEKVTNEVLENISAKRTLLNNILCRKANWIGHILRSKRNNKKKNTAP